VNSQDSQDKNARHEGNEDEAGELSKERDGKAQIVKGYRAPEDKEEKYGENKQ